MARSLESAGASSALVRTCQDPARALSCSDTCCAILSVSPGPVQARGAVPVNHPGLHLPLAFAGVGAIVTIRMVDALCATARRAMQPASACSPVFSAGSSCRGALAGEIWPDHRRMLVAVLWVIPLPAISHVSTSRLACARAFEERAPE